MNNIKAYFKSIARSALAFALLCPALQSCDNLIYDEEGDCSVQYRMKFVYDKNMKWADAFPNEVKSVRLYAFGEDGRLIWQKTESGERLAEEGYMMPLDIPAGKYHFVAWAGLDNMDADEKHFSLPEARAAGELELKDLICSLNRLQTEDGATSDKQLDALFHGAADIELQDMSTVGGTYDYKISLTKNTNHVRVILQHLSGEDVDINDFTFRIDEENGMMAHDNSLLADEIITYRPHALKNGTAGLGLEDYPMQGMGSLLEEADGDGVTKINVAIADLTIARLVEGRKTFLTINTKNNPRQVARIPLVDYALMLKDGYGREMSDQDYLDRQDDYTLTFFLDNNQKWIGSSIIINSWKVVINNVNFQ